MEPCHRDMVVVVLVQVLVAEEPCRGDPVVLQLLVVEVLEEDNKELGAQSVDPLAAEEEPCCGNPVVVGGDSKE